MESRQFASLAGAVQRPLRRFLTALCLGDSDLADDVAQEALLKAYLSCAGFDNVDKFKAWIFRIAYTTFLNVRRSQRSTVGYEEAYDLPGRDASDSSFKYQELNSALNLLPAKERAALLLYYMEGWTVKEIAAMTSASESAVKQQLSRGRAHLRGILTTGKS